MSEENVASAPAERLLTVAEFAREIGKTERQVYRYVKSGRVHSLSPEETGQAGVRFASSEVERFLADNSSASGGWRVRSASAGVGSSFESFEDSAEGLSASAADLDSSDEYEGRAAPMPEIPLTVPLERHEAAVMRLGYLQSQYEQSQRLLTEGSDRVNQLNDKIAALQSRLEQIQEKAVRADQLERELAQAVKRSELLEEAEFKQKDKLAELQEQALKQSQRVKELEMELAQALEKSANIQQEGADSKTQLEEAQEQIMRFKVKAEVEADSRNEVESRLRHLTVRLEEAERRASLPWWKRIFG